MCPSSRSGTSKLSSTMSGLACELIVIFPLAPSRLLGGLIQLVLAELERPANCQVDIPDKLFRYLDRYLYHATTSSIRYLELSKSDATTTGSVCQGTGGTVLLGLHDAVLSGLTWP